MTIKLQDVSPKDWVELMHATSPNSDYLAFYVREVGPKTLTSTNGIIAEMGEWTIEILHSCSTNPTAPGYYRLDWHGSSSRERCRMLWLKPNGEWKYLGDDDWRGCTERDVASWREGALGGRVTGFELVGFSQQPALTFTELKDAS